MAIGEKWFGWEEVNRLIRGRRVVFFGRGYWLEKTLPYLPVSGDYILDNNRYEQGQTERGMAIFHPERLRQEIYSEIFVIITTSGFQEVEQQIGEYGLIPGEHFCVSPALMNFRVISSVNEHRQTLYFTCSDCHLKGETGLKGGGFYRYEIHSGALEKVINGLCHGVVSGHDTIYLVDDTVGIRLLDRASLTERACFDLPAKSGPHGIAYCPERHQLFVSLSGHDAIAILAADDGRMVDKIYLSHKWAKDGVAKHHVNDLYVYGDSLFASMFSLTGNWKLGIYDGGIVEFDIDRRERVGTVVDDLWMPHSPFIINDTLFYCNSMRGRLYGGNRRLVSKFNGFIRGIAYDGQFYYVGQSMHRHVDRRQGTTHNISLDAGLFIIEPQSLVTKFFAMPQITDIAGLWIPPD